MTQRRFRCCRCQPMRGLGEERYKTEVTGGDELMHCVNPEFGAVPGSGHMRWLVPPHADGIVEGLLRFGAIAPRPYDPRHAGLVASTPRIAVKRLAADLRALLAAIDLVRRGRLSLGQRMSFGGIRMGYPRDADLAKHRDEMVERTIIARWGSLRNSSLTRCGRYPRILLPVALREFAYADAPLPIEEEQTISQPYIVAPRFPR